MNISPSRLAHIPHSILSSPEEIIEEARNGRMYILVDDENRENEGDLIVPAQMATPDAINFMAKHGRGLICLAMSQNRVAELGLDLMSARNNTRHRTAFTVSIEARDGVTTGISAADRARTVAVAIDSARGSEHIVTPGHIFPIAARDGGVLVRAGHTEASVDVSRLAGLNPSAVICEIMKDDGTMARLDDLIPFAEANNLKIGAIRDLIAYRRRHDHLVEKQSEARFVSEWGGEWTANVFFNRATRAETLVLLKGKIDPAKPTMVRMHNASIFPDMLGEATARAGILGRSMEIIAEAGSGVVVILTLAEPHGLSSILSEHIGHPDGELRDYGTGAQILAELGIHDMILLTNSQHTMVGLDGYGLSVVGQIPIDDADKSNEALPSRNSSR